MNDTDVNSSSQPCESSSSTTNRTIVESTGSSAADQIQDSTRRNGDVLSTSDIEPLLMVESYLLRML
jgi:predicted methyltransferase